MRRIIVSVCLVFVLLILVLSISSCIDIDTDNKNNYEEFLNVMSSRSEYIYDIIPKLDENAIDDLYLFYSDKDLLDSFYSIYINCCYSDEDYESELLRISSLSDKYDFDTEKSNEFDLDAKILDYNIDISVYKSPIRLIQNSYILFSHILCSYILFDDNSNRVVYVMIFEKDLDGKSLNIPEIYLPKKLVKLRSDYLQ